MTATVWQESIFKPSPAVPVDNPYRVRSSQMPVIAQMRRPERYKSRGWAEGGAGETGKAYPTLGGNTQRQADVCAGDQDMGEILMKLKPNLWNVLMAMWVISLSTATVSFGAWSAIELGTALKPAKTICTHTGITAIESLILCTGVCKLLKRHERRQCLRRVKQQFLDASESEKYDCFINLVNLAGFRFSDVRMTQEQRREAMRYLTWHGILNVFAPGDQQFVAWSIAEENRDQTEREWSMQHLPDQPEPLHGSPLSLNAQMTGKSCQSCKFYYGTDGIHCAVHPFSPESDECRDWEQTIETYTWGFIGVKYADRHVYYIYRHDADDGGYINVFNDPTDRGVMALSPSNQQMFLHYFGLQYPSALPKKTFCSEHWEGREAIAQIRSMSSHS